MKIKIKKNVVYIIAGILSLVFGSLYTPQIQNPNTDYSILETSMLSILQRLADKVIPDSPDLAIEKFSIKKVSDPDDNLNYYKYLASIYIKNVGDDIVNSKAVLHVDKNRHVTFLKNQGDKFSLKSGQGFVLRGYEILFDGRYNAGKMAFEVELLDTRVEDENPDNNKYEINVFELPAQIKDIRVDEILETGEFVLDYDDKNYAFDTLDFEILFSDSLDIEDQELKYSETQFDGKIYPYHVIPNSKKHINSRNWKMINVNSKTNPRVKVYNDPFNPEKVYYLYMRAFDHEKGNYKFSDILRFGPTEQINRAQFAYIFVDELRLNPDDLGLIHYEDIDFNEWYAPAVQTIYNLGLTDMKQYKYKPSDMISRQEVLRTVLDYFDIDLVRKFENPRFEDVSVDDDIYPYTQALSASGKADGLARDFVPDANASKEFLIYLLNECIESN